MNCIFVSDLHGSISRYEKLFKIIYLEEPDLVLIGGDILPLFSRSDVKIQEYNDFINDYLMNEFSKLKEKMKDNYPVINLILGNDDLKIEESEIQKASKTNLFNYINFRKVEFNQVKIFGYSYVPPTPFLLKDWEKYDVSRYVDPGCISPEEGFRSVPVELNEIKYSTIKKDLENLTKGEDLSQAVFLFHSPPYQTNLDRVANDGKFFEYVPLDLNAGSIAIKKFIEEKQPLVTLHGHIHESTRLTKSWKDKIGETYCFNAAHDGPELSIIKFEINNLKGAVRLLL